MSYWKKTLRTTVLVLSYLIPKNKNLWLFLPTHYNGRCEGNIRSVFEYVYYHVKDVKPWCLHKDKNTSSEALLNNGSIFTRNIRALWLILRAAIIYVDGGDGSSFKGNFKLVQLWHGTGFKKIINLCREDSRKTSGENFLLVVAGSGSDKKLKQKAFNTSKVFVTGEPLLDDLLKHKHSRKIKREYDYCGYRKIFTYVPTFRDYPTKAPFSHDFYLKLQKHLEENN